jgi:MerR family transcriptional regulator, redox-sensitive transcriptional activator SoxR
LTSKPGNVGRLTNVTVLPKQLSIGQLADRADISVPTARYYESLGLIRSARTSSNQRRYERGTLRRVAFIAAAQRLGLTLAEIGETLALLPDGRDPTRADWTRLSRPWRALLDTRITELLRLRDQLDSCIGCGCLSLRRCHLYNRGDEASQDGGGARWLREP